MKRNHKRFLALCLSASMLVSPLSYTKAYASDEAGITENSSQNETAAETDNKSENQSPSSEETGNTSGQEKETVSKDNGNTADAEKAGSVADQKTSQQTAEAGQTQGEAADTELPTAPTAAITGVKVLKSDGTSYGMFPIDVTKMEVNGDHIDISFNTGAKKVFDQLYLGAYTDEQKSKIYTGKNTGSTVEFSIEVPVSKKNSWIPVAIGKTSDNSWKEEYLWMSIPDPSAPVITEQPQGKTVKSGEKVALSVKASGDNLSYQWQYSADGTTWKNCDGDAAKKAEYSFTMTADLAGQYRCMVQNQFGADVVSDAAKVALQEETGKDDQETDDGKHEGYLSNDGIQAIYASDDAKKPGQTYGMFKIAASQAVVSGSNINVSIWVSPASNGSYTYDAIYIGSRKDEVKDPIIKGEEDSKGQKYTFTVPVSMAGKEVHFVPRNRRTQNWSTTSSLAFKLPDLSKFQKPSVITITTQPKDTSTKLNKQVTLSVAAETDAEGTLSYQWQYSADGTTWEDCTEISAKTAEYTFTVTDKTVGKYHCVVSDVSGTKVESDAVNVTELKAPAVTGSKVKVVKADGTDYKMFTVSESKVQKDGDTLDVTFATENVTYDQIYLGEKEDEIKNAVKGTQIEKNGKTLWTFTLQLPVSAMGKVLPISLHSQKNNTWYAGMDLWIYIPDEGVTDIPVSEGEVKAIAGGTGAAYGDFAVVSSKAVLRGETITMTLGVKGNKWTKLYQGVQADSDKSDSVSGIYDADTNVTTFTFTVPASKQGMNIAVTPGNDAGWFTYARDLFINVPNLEGKANTTENGTYELYGSAYPTNNYASLNFERGSRVKINGDTATVTMITQSSSYDKIYIGNVADSDADKDAKAVTATDRSDIASGYKCFTFTIPTADLGKEIYYVVHESKKNVWAVKQSSFYINGILDVAEDLPTPDPDPTPDPEPSTPEDGSYNNIGVTSSASMFKVVDCKLVVKDGKLTAVLTLSGTGYGYLYKGTAKEAAAADQSTWIPFVEDANGKYTYSLPLNSLEEKVVDVAAYSIKNEKWYDRKLTFDFSNMDRIYPTAADGTYTIDVESSASMFRVVACKLTVKDGKMSAVLTLSGTGYDYLFVGTSEDAEKADSKSWVPYVADANGKYTYTIPVEALDKEIAVAAHSIKNNKWYDRTLTFKYDTLQKVNDDGSTDPSTPTIPTKPSDNKGNSGASKPNDGKADNESKWEADTSGSTSAVNSSTTLADGVYTPDRFSWSGGTGKVKISCNKVTITNGQAFATLVFDSDHYQYVKANGKTYYTTKGGGTATVVIPVALNENNTILAMTDKMSVAHEIAYTIFVYLAAAGNGKGAGTVQNKTLDDKAPEIMGLNYESETKLEHAEYFKIYHYDKGITLLEVDVTKDTVRDPEKKDSDKKDTDTNKDTGTNEDSNKSEEALKDQTSEAADSAEDGEAVVSEAEQAAELYRGNVIKYLLVPENTVIPVGLSEDMIVVQMPTDKAYVSDNEMLKQMEEMDLLDQVSAVGVKKKNCKVSDIADKMSKKKDEKQAEVIYGGKEKNLKYRDLVKQEVNLALVSSNLLPAEDKTTKKGKTITEEEQSEQWEKITEKYALLGIPMIVDRSADEKDDLAKAEWIKVYGVIFGCEEQAEDLYNKAVQQAGEK